MPDQTAEEIIELWDARSKANSAEIFANLHKLKAKYAEEAAKIDTRLEQNDAARKVYGEPLSKIQAPKGGSRVNK
jgi:hypothetical protein